MNIEQLIRAFLDEVEKDGKTGKDLAIGYVIDVLRRIYNQEND